MNDKKSGQYRQLKQISDMTFLEESSHLKIIFKGIIVVVALVIAFIVWSAFVTIKESTKTLGQLIPKGEVQVVQHLEGGIVIGVYVSDGDEVKKGQLLIQLSTVELRSQLDQLRSQEVALTLDAARLNAFLQNKPANMQEWGDLVVSSKYNPIQSTESIKKLLEDQNKLLESEYAEIRDKKASLENILIQRKEKLVDLQNQEAVAKVHVTLLVEEFEMYKKLKTNNYISQKDYLTVMRSVNQAQGDVAKLASQISQAKEDIGETENKLKEIESSARQDALEKLAKTHGQLLEIHYKIRKEIDQIERSAVRAPVDGEVQGSAVFAGNVVKPGATLLEIVPADNILLGETKIPPREIGYIHKGDPAEVRILTYDYARFGSIKGKVINISASTFKEQDGTPYYKAKIELAQQQLGSGADAKKLKAGMTIEADIITGSKTLLEYILKPIQRAVSDSFRER